MIVNNDLTAEGRVMRIKVEDSPELYVIICKYHSDLILEVISDWSYATSRYLDYVDSINRAVATRDMVRGTTHFLNNKNDIHTIFQQSTASKLSNHLIGFFEDDYDNGFSSSKLQSAETLKCICFYCQVELNPNQRYKWETSKYEVETTCHKCGRKDSTLLSQEQISQCNSQGGYQMSLGK